MSPEERTMLQGIGLLFGYNITGYGSFVIVYGIYISLFMLSLSAMRLRGSMTYARYIMLGTSLTSFLLATLSLCCYLFVFVTEIQVYLVDAGLDQASRVEINKRAMGPDMILGWVIVLLSLNSDIVVVWRAWILFSDQRWMMILPLCLFLGTAGAAIAHIILSGLLLVDYDTWVAGLTQGNDLGVHSARLFGASWILSLVFNGITTLLMIYKFWTLNRLLRGRRRKTSHVQKVMSILVETGMVYTLFQLANVVMEYTVNTAVYSPAIYFQNVFWNVYTVFAAMYPSLVVVLVNQHRSLVETFGFSGVYGDRPDHVESTADGKAADKRLFSVPPPPGDIKLEDMSTAPGSTADVVMATKEKARAGENEDI
ncbi:hypothetical protein FPV67DRAFT_1100792 [Lyophyllum atratum]|nr:hypothetical protein FPV67DRAFT_1100792 [Lyophyllum atratum]